MTGEREGVDRTAHGTCALCGGSTHVGSADIPLRTRNGVLLVRGVPAEVCGDCEEPYMTSSVVDRIGEIAREIEALESEISVVQFKAA